ncbi:tannase and feruloyl esterase [Mycena vulgaris]|nr:tannase and feruloyl esterase [Mycena vulgaris]
MLCSAILLSAFSRAGAADLSAKCHDLKNDLQLENTTILDISGVAARYVVRTFPGLGERGAEWIFIFTRFAHRTQASNTSTLTMAHRSTLQASALTTGPPSGLPFLNAPEVIDDYVFRAVHIEAIFGKQLVAAYYNTPAAKSYFLGCSTGGRQGTQAALRFPEDFDGIIAGSPPTDFNHLSGWDGLLGHYIGAVDTDSSAKAEASPKFITPELWAALSAEILRQCDELDGLVDGIIVEPDDCDFQPDMLLCDSNSTANQTTGFLTQVQVEVLKNIYSPLFGADGHLLYPRYSPGAEANPLAASIFGGTFLQLTAGWKRYAILNVTEHDFTNFSVQDIALFDAINPGGVATFDGDMSAFRERGGKFITYHGRRDPLISLTNSKRVCDLISHTLSLPPAQMDDFYRVLLIPGMGHCFGGVDWIEGGAAPATIIGSDESGAERTHCRLTPPLKLNPSA